MHDLVVIFLGMLNLNMKHRIKFVIGKLVSIISGIPNLVVGPLNQGSYFLRWLSAWLTFVPRQDDIYIVTYPRSGTTWMQMILYQMTTDGNMDFTHISEVVPFFEKSMSSGKNFNSMPSPRIFKTHLRKIPNWPGKYIYVARNGKDVAVSYYHFYKSHIGFKGTFEEFFERFLKGKLHYGSWFKHVSTWKARASQSNVLFLNYEDLLENFESCLEKMAAFCELDISPEKYKDIIERCSFDFMKKYENKFDPITEFLLDQGFVQHTFLRKGGAGASNTHLTTKQKDTFYQVSSKWRIPI